MDLAMVVVQTTLPDSAESEQLVQRVVEQRLAACANWHRVRSAYWWLDQLEHDDEINVTFKTSPEARGALVAALRTMHPYEVPFIAWSAVEGVDPAYTEWVAGEATGGRKASPSS
jgi:periplasmic divalent cation tolerance protein